MDWTSQALLLSAREIGPQSFILNVFTHEYGRVRGVVRVGKKVPFWLMYKSNLLQVRWCARLSDQLGTFFAQPLGILNFFSHISELGALNLVLALLQQCPERQPYGELFLKTCAFIRKIKAHPLLAALYIIWELEFLSFSGFGLDISVCALTGAKENLAFISPRTGRAATKEAAEPFKDKLLPLPPFLLDNVPPLQQVPSHEHILEGFQLTGFFLKERDLIPEKHAFWKERQTFVSSVEKLYEGK